MVERTLRCAHCGMPIAQVKRGMLVIVSRHHGRRHVNGISIDYLARLARDEGPTLADQLTGVVGFDETLDPGTVQLRYPGRPPRVVATVTGCGTIKEDRD